MFSPPTSTDLPYVVIASLLGLLLILLALRQLRSDLSTRSPQELLYRRQNYLPLALVLAIAVFLLPDLVDESIPTHHLDEFIDYALGLIALIWLFHPSLRFHSFPFWIIIASLALITNLSAILVEHAELDDVGGDILTSSAMILGIIIHLYRLRNPKPHDETPTHV
jgi:hypothetical protein